MSPPPPSPPFCAWLCAFWCWDSSSGCSPAAALPPLVLTIVLEGGLVAAYTFRSADFQGLFPNLMEQLSLFDRFYEFVNGTFDLTAIVYYLTVIAVFVFLTVQSLEKRRWSE